MQKIRPISQNFKEILTFENLEKMRFCHNLTYKNFLDRGLIYWIFSYLYVFKKSFFAI